MSLCPFCNRFRWWPFGNDAICPFLTVEYSCSCAGLLGAQPEVYAVAAEWIPPQIQTSKGKRGAASWDSAQAGSGASGIGRKLDRAQV